MYYNFRDGRGGDGPDEYVCDAYTFYVCPHSHFGGHDPAFVLKPSSIEFLAQNNFDFNKFLREGVPYLNDEGEERLQQVLRDQVASKGIEMKNVALGDQDMIREKACQVSEWANSCHAKTARNLKRTEIVYEGSCPSTWYLLHRAIRSAHPYVWTSGLVTYLFLLETKLFSFVSPSTTPWTLEGLLKLTRRPLNLDSYITSKDTEKQGHHQVQRPSNRDEAEK